MTIRVPAVVVGGGIGGLAAGYRLATLGVPPVVLESRSRVGGLVFGARVGGQRVDLGAESFAKRSRPAAALCAELGLEVIDPSRSSWIWSHGRPRPDAEPGFPFPIPHGVLGIPTSLDDPDVVGGLSPHGLARAKQDLTMGADIGADAVDLASLVTLRLGPEVLERLVEPVAGGVHSSHPSTLAVDVVSPGLRGLLAREGSLIRAAAAQRAAAPAGAVVSSVTGGLFQLPQRLAARISELGGTIGTRRIVTGIARVQDRWHVTVCKAGRGLEPSDPPVPDGPAEVIDTPLLVVAVDGRASLGLLKTVPGLDIGDWQLPAGADLAQVCLVLTNPALDAGPRGSGLLVTPPKDGDIPTVTCKALTHYSHKWPWSGAAGKHVLRVSYGRAGQPRPEPTLSGALADASRLLGVELTAAQVDGHTIVRFPNSLPPPTPAHRERVAALDAAVSRTPGLAVTGAWFAGTGLAAVIPHGAAVADRLVDSMKEGAS